MEWVIGCVVGIGLAAAAGFRLFVPLLGLSLAYTLDWMEPSAAFHWLDSWIAVTALGVATIVEIGAFYVPWLDHLLDVAVAPLSVVAGTLLMASSLGESSPALQWGLSIVAGGGVAAAVQAGTTATRGVSGVTTAGLANPLVSTFELLASVAMTLLALLVPVLALALFAVLVVLLYRIWSKRQRSKAAQVLAT
jgi:hypothetical protein